MTISTKRLSRTIVPMLVALWAAAPASAKEVLSVVFPPGGPWVDFGPCNMTAIGKFSLEGVGQVTVRSQWTSPVKMPSRTRGGQDIGAPWFGCSAGCLNAPGYEPENIGQRIRSLQEPRGVVDQPDGWARVYDRTVARRGDFSVWIAALCNGGYGHVTRAGERFEVSVEVTPGMTLTVEPNENQGANASTPRDPKGDATPSQTSPKQTGDTSTPATSNPSSPVSTGPSDQPKQTTKACPDNATQLQLQICRHTAAQGATIRVPIHLLKSDNLANLNLELRYDPAVAKPASKAEKGPMLGGQALLESNVGQAGLARIGFAGSGGVSGSGILAWVPFTLVGGPGSHTALTLQDTAANTVTNARPSFALVAGEIAVTQGQSTSTDPKPKSDTPPQPSDPPKQPEPVKVFTALDALKALQMSVGLMGPDMAYDLDKTGQITSNDARLILRSIVGRQP